MGGHQHGSAEENLVAALAERAEDIAAAMLALSRDEVPGYAAFDDPEFIAAGLQHSRDHVAAFLTVARERRMLRSDELQFVRTQAALRARQGVPLDPLLHVYRMGHVAVHNAIVAAAGDSRDGLEAAIELTRRTLSHIDLISTTFAEEYLRTQHRLLAETQHAQRDLLERALTGSLLPDGSDGDQARALGFDPDAPYVAVVVLPRPDANMQELAAVVERLKAGSGRFGRSALGTMRNGEGLVALPTSTRSVDDLVEATREAVNGRVQFSGGVSGECTGLAELRRGYTQARAMAVHAAPGEILSLGSLTPFDYLGLTADDTARALVDPRVAAALRDDAARGGSLLATFAAYLDADLNAAAAAERLFVHPNTVYYRLTKLAQATGRDMRRFPHLLEIATAARILDVSPAAAAAAEAAATRSAPRG